MSENPYDVEKALAEQQSQASRFLRDLEDIGRAEQVGMWFPPAGLEGMHFFRCGVRHGDGSMPPQVARIYHKHKAMGAADAPPGMRPPYGFESDGRNGVYVWYHPQTWANITEAKRLLARRRPSTSDVMQRELGALGVELTVSKGYDKPKRGTR